MSLISMCTGEVAAFTRLGTRFLQMPLGEVVRVDLGAGAAEVAAAGRLTAAPVLASLDGERGQL